MSDMLLEAEQKQLDEQAGVTKSYIAGCDEAGRGPFAGPLVAAAVIYLKMQICLKLQTVKR